MNLLKSTNTSNPHELSNEISCIVFVNDSLLINEFSIKVGFLPTIENPILNDIALEKIEIFFNLFMQNAIIINKKDYDDSATFTKIQNNFFMVPDKPNDQTIGSLIFSKLVAIVGEDLEINYIKISSELGKNILYTLDADSSELECLLPKKSEWWEDDNINFMPWWSRTDTATYDILINRDEIYQGDVGWEDIFKDELEKLKQAENTAKGRFKIISGGKDEVK